MEIHCDSTSEVLSHVCSTESAKVMECNVIKLIYHMGGSWVRKRYLRYINGRSVVEKGDSVSLSFIAMLAKYRDDSEINNIEKLCYLRPGKKVKDEELTVLDGDDGINEIIHTCLELDMESVIHIYPYDDIIFNRPVLETQCSATLGLEGCEIEVVMDKGKNKVDELGDLLVTENEGPVDEPESDFVTEIEGEMGDTHANNSETNSDSESSDSEVDSEGLLDDEVDMRLIEQSRRPVLFVGDDDNPHFLLGMTFGSAKEARDAITKYSISKSTPLKLNPNEPQRIGARCKSAGCPFYLFISQTGKCPNLVVKKFLSEHNCVQNSRNRAATSSFLATQFKDMINEKPTMTTTEFMKEIEKQMYLYVPRSTAKRAKRIVKNDIDDSYKQEFAILEAHVELWKKTNPGTTAILDLCDKQLRVGRHVFKRLYLCFEALKLGWKRGCRPIIGIDGCHLKGVVKGQVLVAVGKDAQDQIFPIAWAVVDKENGDNWQWFMQLLVNDLEITDRGRSLTIISDMQKGLLNAVQDVLPMVEHRYCARHVEANWTKKWNSGELRKRFWYCVKSTYEPEFVDNLKKLGAISKEAAEDFVAYKPQMFCKAFFSSRCNSDTCDNNFCEAFNASIKNARFKPIVSMLNEIRESAMARLATHKNAAEKWPTKWSTSCMTKYQLEVKKSFGCKVIFNGEDGYQVGDRGDEHVVRLGLNECTCRLWDLTGIPCRHAIIALNHSNDQDPKNFISPWFEKVAYNASYQMPLQPVPSKKFINLDGIEILEPPPFTRQPGRPRVKRMRSAQERRKGQNSGILGKKGVAMTCSICRSNTHNKATCPEKEKDKEMDKSQNKGKEKVVEKQTGAVNNKRPKKMVGMGLYVENSSGNTIYNPGMSSEIVVTHSAYRRIAFANTGTQVVIPKNLPFNPPGPTWKGKPCTTRSELEKKRENLKKSKNM